MSAPLTQPLAAGPYDWRWAVISGVLSLVVWTGGAFVIGWNDDESDLRWSVGLAPLIGLVFGVIYPVTVVLLGFLATIGSCALFGYGWSALFVRAVRKPKVKPVRRDPAIEEARAEVEKLLNGEI